MTMFDATRIATSWGSDDPNRWATPAPEPVRRPVQPSPRQPFSWFALVRNPQAALMTGLVGTMMAGDVLRRTALGG